MLDETISQIYTYFLIGFSIVAFIALFFFGLELNSIANFKQSVNYEIERASVIDTALETRINAISTSDYSNNFKVVITNKANNHGYGAKIDYVIDVDIDWMLDAIPNFQTRISGSAMKRTR